MFVSRTRSVSVPVVLGIDPGLTRCGYAIVQADGTPELVAMGVVTTAAADELPHRLARLQADLAEIFDQYAPTAVAIERVFFQHNTRTAMSVGQASGIVLAMAAARGCEVAQYTPSQVKNAVAGDGAADKLAMQRMVQLRFGMKTLPTPADAADAAALAICHIAISPFARSVAGAMAR
ncbi:MAG: crossover junction endodeoxyribonuclease RuvC [Actinomycetota bacterium]